MDKPVTGWTFFTNHARVLVAIAREPGVRIRDIAACRISERTVQSAVADLEKGGYLSRKRHGRRTHYTVHLDGTFRHPAEAHLPVRALLALSPDRNPGRGVTRQPWGD
ncbi:helix-turn-helix domain-containing protein [Streptomyces sp. ISL-100]|uniref:helix-turn-helix transcriptional regulator n=1 Tax=Streptomyces sp. ISL-100 TaxID=2819173 RepID=UPI0027E50284|nr:helix-turn-helix domain-containing protein [Streptomyces sp. ISL-100]